MTSVLKVLGRCKEKDKQNRILERVDVYPVEEYFSDIDQNDWKVCRTRQKSLLMVVIDAFVRLKLSTLLMLSN